MGKGGKGAHDPYNYTGGGGTHQPQFHHEHDLDHYHPHRLQHKKLRSVKLSWRARLFLTFEEPEYSYTARFISFLLNCCIFLSVVAFILSTMDQFQHEPHHCRPYMVVGHVCYGEHGEVTQVIQTHEAPLLDGPPPAGALPVTPEEGPHGEETGAGAGAAGAGGAGVEAEAAHHRFLQQQWEAAQLPQPPQKQRRWWNQPRALWSRALAPAVPEPAAAPAAAAAEGAAAHAHAEEGAGAAGHGAEEAHGGAEEEHHGGGGHDTSPGCHPVCEPEPIHAVEYVEMFAMLFFTLDYLMRLLTVHAVPFRLLDSNAYHRKRAAGHYREPSGLRKTVSYFFHTMMLVDLLALAPFYFRTVVERVAPSLMESGIFRVFRLLRIFRIAPFYMHMVVSTHGVVKSGDKPHFMRFDLTWFFDLLKIGDYAEGAPLIFWTIKSSFPAVAVAILATFVLTVAMGTMMYLAEHGMFRVTAEYPQGAFLVPADYGTGASGMVESPHANIFMSMFYIVSDTTTMQTIQMLVPHTASGMSIDVIVDYVALMIISLPIAIVVRNFCEQYEYFFKSFDEGEEEEDEWDGFEAYDEEDNEEAILFGFLDEGNLQQPQLSKDEGDDDIEMVAGPANNTFFTAGKADPWVMVEKGEASDVAMGLPSGRSTRPPTPGPKEGGDGETNGRRSRMDVKIQ